MAEQEFEIDVPEQGVSKRLSKNEALNFFDEELAFYGRISGVMNQNVQFGQWGLGQQHPILNEARNRCQSIRQSIQQDQQDQLKRYVKDAKSFMIVIGQGRLGTHIERLVRTGKNQQAQWLFVMFNERNDNNPWIEPFRAIALGSPAMLDYPDIAVGREARQRSEEALARSMASEGKLNEFIAEKRKIVDQLEELYRKKLVIEEPANSWQRVANSKRKAWRLWLLIFAVLVVGPIAAVIAFWEQFSSSIAHLATTGTGVISLTGVAAVSLPALLYAWLLKNVSRIFIQTLNLADDAAHRRALAVTYLGLVENPKIQLLEAERAIILNALFRPIPTQAGDEGPPAGLIDLIRGKHP